VIYKTSQDRNQMIFSGGQNDVNLLQYVTNTYVFVHFVGAIARAKFLTKTFETLIKTICMPSFSRLLQNLMLLFLHFSPSA